MWIELLSPTQPMDFLTQLIYLLHQLIRLISSVTYLVETLKSLFRRRPPMGFQVPKQRYQPPKKGKWSKSYLNDPKNRQLQHDLLTLLRGDVPTAKRLLGQQRRLHPGKSDNWYLEKVIHDLQRDRV